MAVAAVSIAFLVATLACVERLVRARRAVQVLWTVPPLVASWVLLWWLRLPPTPGHALLAFGLADLAVLAVSMVAVTRLLGGFEGAAPLEEDDRGDDERPEDPAPQGPHPAGPSRSLPRGRGGRPRGGRTVSASRRSARGSGTRAPSRSSSSRTG
ncbi:MAG: hypothetical protein KDC46_10720 [Thermoleophilia bacterium]|nr:hypothetical protein [Thermoleophilia bacterium]